MTNSEKRLAQISADLIAYLRAELNDAMIDYDTPLTQITGGYETYTCHFKLSGVQGELSKPLVLRLFPQFYGPDRAVWESTVQNVLADEGYPAARVYFTCPDMTILGGAFFIMAFLPGETMAMAAPAETTPDMLGKAHAALHSIDPEPLLKSLRERGFEEHRYRLDGRLGWLNDMGNKYPWLREGVDWLLNNRPPESERLSICHGDFHPLNILVKEGKVTGVLDWPGFIIADPVLDVAYTVVLITIPVKYLFPEVEWKKLAKIYLASYSATSPLDRKSLAYYRVVRCILAFIDGAEGQEVWQRPLIVKDLTAYIHETTGIRITPQSRPNKKEVLK